VKNEINAITENIRIRHLIRQPRQPPFFDSVIHSSLFRHRSGSSTVSSFS